MQSSFTLNHEIQKMLKDRNLYEGNIDGIIGEQTLTGIEHLFFQMRINYAGWPNKRKIVGAEELFYKSQGIDVGDIDGYEDHYLQYARDVYKAKLLTTWRDKAEELKADISSIQKNEDCSVWANKYTLTQKALGITGKEYDAYREAVGYIESRNNPNQGSGGAGGHYWGMYQFGSAATETVALYFRETITKEQFQGNQDLAEKYFDGLSFLNHKTLSNSDEYNNLSPQEKLAVLGYAHNQGAGGAKRWLQTGQEGRDAFGTSGKKYYDAILAALKTTKIETPNIIFIGDSVAQGLLQFNDPNGIYDYVKIGIGPKKILEIIQSIPTETLSGKIIVLSAGLLNNVTDVANVEHCIRELKSKNATVHLVGGPKKDQSSQEVIGVNEKLEEIAAQENVIFLGSYDSNDGVHPKSYKSYSIKNAYVKPVVNQQPPKTVEPQKGNDTFSLKDIDINQLKFIRGIGQTESGFSKKEAYSEAYNKASNNRNVRQYGQKGADYGYYQCNEFDVEDAIRRGVSKDIAVHLNGGGRNGKSSVAQQTIAMHEYIKRAYTKEYEALKSGDDDALESAIDRMDGKWFGLRDRPEEVRKIWKRNHTHESLFPETFSNTTPNIIVEQPKIIVPPKKTYNWPKQRDCMSFYGNVGTNQVKCNLPFPMVLAWDTGTKLTSYSCHKLVKEPMERIWNRVYEHYGYEKIVELRLNRFGGCLNVRQMRGGSSWSMHSWGIAVDIDPDRNTMDMNKTQASLSKPAYDKYWEFIYDEGAIGLGPERDFDWMHWQFAKL